MKKNKINFRIILYILLFLNIYNVAHSTKLNKYFDDDKISKYFSGVSSLYDNQYDDSYKYLKEIEGLEDRHYSYSQFYQYSLINSGRIIEAYRYSKKLENKNLGNFESKLIIGIYYLKNKNYDQALKYFQKFQSVNQTDETLRGLVSISLKNWAMFLKTEENNAINMINKMSSKFENIKKIQKTFAHCFFDSKFTEGNFQKIVSDKETDFSRYSFFYANYLIRMEKFDDAENIVNKSLEKNPRNLLLKQLKADLDSKKIISSYNQFDCKNLSHVNAEILYVVANALSSQHAYNLSNFYLNLAKYLNPNFISFDALYAENFYNMNKLEIAKKFYRKMINKKSIYAWHASKKIFNILREQNKEEESFQFLKKSFNKTKSPDVDKIYDYARFLKNNEKFDDAIRYYTQVLGLINKDHYLYPKATDGRGVAYERTDNWEKAEKDLLNSLSVSPDQAYVINYLAYSWIEKGINIEKSLKMLKRANSLREGDGYITDSLGWALFKLKRYKEAEKYLRLAVILMPSDPIINDHYGDILWINNKKIQARYHWNYVSGLEDVEEKLRKSVKEKAIFGLELKTDIKKS